MPRFSVSAPGPVMPDTLTALTTVPTVPSAVRTVGTSASSTASFVRLSIVALGIAAEAGVTRLNWRKCTVGA